MKYYPWIVAGILLLTQTHVESAEISPNEKGVLWSQKMQDLYTTLADLLTDVASDQRFKNPKNYSRIQNNANKLLTLTHDMDRSEKIPDGDPTLPIVGNILHSNLEQAATQLKAGNRAYARTILRSVPGYCIACHTRNMSGPQFSKLPLAPKGKLSPLERGEFFTATRQFDRAQKEFLSVIQGSAEGTGIWDWDSSIRQALSIAIRVKKDPDQTKEIVQNVLRSPIAPTFMKDDAKTWLSSVQEWQKESSRRTPTEDGLYIEAARLMDKAREIQKYPMDRSADVYFLRAGAVLHELLQVAPKGQRAPEALLLTGIVYEVMNPIQTDNLHEIYYETCIRKVPHTALAEVCYQRYEKSVYLGYTGSSGTHLPPEVRKHLSNLQKLSQPESATKN